MVDLCIIFVTSPELSLEREGKNKLVQRAGRVMNPELLTSLRDSAVSVAGTLGETLPAATRIHLVDTEKSDGDVRGTALLVLEHIAATLNSRGLNIDPPEMV